MQVWVLEVKDSYNPSRGWNPWLSYIAKSKWMLQSRLKGNNCLLADKETRVVKYTLTKKKESNVKSKKG